MLSIILQIYSFSHLITGSVIAAAGSSAYAESGKSKFDFFYQ